jgi:hypothetical protein
MFAIIKEHYDKVTLKRNTGQISSIKIDTLMNLVDINLNYVDMTGDMALLSSEILSLRLCKSAECV